ncbi:hypothetical protein M1D93_08805 [Arthrobacter sp. Z1-9]
MSAATSPAAACYNRMAIISVVCAVLAVAKFVFAGLSVLAVSPSARGTWR